jgi:hypothetical protein
VLSGLHYLVAGHLETGEDPPSTRGRLEVVSRLALGGAASSPPPAPPRQPLQLRRPREKRFVTAELIKATCLKRTPPELVEQVKTLEGQGLRQIMLYPPLNRQYRVIEDFADNVMARL